MAAQIVKESTKFVKPSTPTPSDLRQFKLGFTDEFISNTSVTVVLFFSVDSYKNQELVVQLEKSLGKILTPFYPIAGRYVEETQTIDCNDQGVEFIKATCNVKLEDLLDSKVDIKLVDEFIPSVMGASLQVTDPLLTIQVTTFECGGVAVGVSVSHKIVDASTLSIFLTKWSMMTREENDVEITGSMFNSPSLFPARGILPLDYGKMTSITDDVVEKNVTLKLSFSDSVISSLKQKMASNERNGNTKWSKVQLVSAIVLKGFIAVDRAEHNHPRDCIVVQPINLREKTASLIPKDSCGNVLSFLATECGITETTEELAEILRDDVRKTVNNFSKIHHDDEEGQTMVFNSFSQLANFPPMANVIVISSWCRLPLYEIDFGFGKPIWASCGSLARKNGVTLMDGIGGNGVEAYVSLGVENVPYFEEAVDMKAVST